VVETEGWTVAKRITDEAFKQPHQIVFSADGRTAFLTNNNTADHMADPAMAAHEMPGMVPGAAALVVIDVQSSSVAKVLMLGENLTGMGTRSRR
jgi:DNA-binding beta-propeller fold protein YncE